MDMKVQAIQNYNAQSHKSPTFGLNGHSYTEFLGLKRIYNSTILFRGDLNWDNFAKKIIEIFKDKKSVNIYSAACSDGSEAYTLAISLLNELGEKNSKKFFPIIASDKNKNIIKAAKQKILNLCDVEVRNRPWLDKYLQKSDKKILIQPDDMLQSLCCETYHVKPNLADKVRFEKLPLLKRIEQIEDDSNTILMCRNVFPYFNGRKEVKKVVEEAAKKLKPGSLFVVGDFDFTMPRGIKNYLAENNFKRLDDMSYVYQKVLDTQV